MSSDPRRGYIPTPGLTEPGINTDTHPDDVPDANIAPGAQVPSRGQTGDDETDYLIDAGRRQGTMKRNYDVPH